MGSLKVLEDTLQKSSQLTDGMVNILTSFEERLIKLEQTIVPVYQETGNLQRRQENIEKTLGALDHVIGYHNVGKQVENIIKEGPNDRINSYIEALLKVTDAIDYFEDNNPNSTELANMQGLFEDGSDALQREFRSILTKHSKPVPTIVMQDVVGLDDDELPHDEERNTIQHMPDSAIQDLIKISNWLLRNGRDDFLNVYSAIRSNIIIKTLQNLKENQKTSSGSSNTLAPLSSPALSRSKAGRDTPTRKASRRIQQALKKKGAAALSKYSGSIDSSRFGISMKRQSSSIVEPRDDVLDQECDFYMTFISALLKLMQAELKLMENIIPKEGEKRIFERITSQSLDTIVQEAESIATRARRCIMKHDFLSVLSIFPMVKHVTQVQNEFDHLFVGCQPSMKAKIPAVVATLHSIGAKALEDFIEHIRNDLDKQMPRDGTVHQQTSNVMMFLEHLLDYDSVGVMAGGQDAANIFSADNTDLNRKLLAKYVVRVLSELGLALLHKADFYNDAYLKAIFKLNNLHYIMKSIQRYGLIEIIAEIQPEIEDYYQDQILDQKRMYSQSWSRVLQFVVEGDKSLSQQKSSPNMSQLKDKERQIIKDKFTGFNREMEEICRIQKGYAIPDVELRESMKRDNKEYILPKYQLFYDKYVNVPFTKNPEKYIKFTPIRVNELINEFFDAAA